MTAAAELLAIMVTTTMVTAAVMTMMPTMMTRILRTLHRRNYGKTIIATATLSRQG
jgi:hypothetical protein